MVCMGYEALTLRHKVPWGLVHVTYVPIVLYMYLHVVCSSIHICIYVLVITWQ